MTDEQHDAIVRAAHAHAVESEAVALNYVDELLELDGAAVESVGVPRNDRVQSSGFGVGEHPSVCGAGFAAVRGPIVVDVHLYDGPAVRVCDDVAAVGFLALDAEPCAFPVFADSDVECGAHSGEVTGCSRGRALLKHPSVWGAA